MFEPDFCVVCGKIIPEGRMICPDCENHANKVNDTISRMDAIKAINHEREILRSRNQFGAEHILVQHAERVIWDLPPVRAKGEFE